MIKQAHLHPEGWTRASLRQERLEIWRVMFNFQLDQSLSTPCVSSLFSFPSASSAR